MSDNPRFPLLGLVTTGFGLFTLAVAGFLGGSLMSLAQFSQFSWAHLTIAVASGWMGFWQCAAGYRLLRHGLAGAGIAADWSEAMLDPGPPLFASLRAAWFADGEIDVERAARSRIVGCTLAGVGLTLLSWGFPDRIPMAGLVPIAAAAWPAVVSLRIAQVHDRLQSARARRRDAISRNPMGRLSR